MTKRLLMLLLTLVAISCGPRTGTTNNTADQATPTQDQPDINQVNHIKEVMATGQKLWKYNCAVCHCTPNGNCEGETINTRLRQTFKNLPMDSLAYFESFIKNSSLVRKTKDSTAVDHKFGEKLTDDQIKIIIESIWLAYRPTE